MRLARAIIGAPDRVEITGQIVLAKNGFNPASGLSGRNTHQAILVCQAFQNIRRPIIKRLTKIRIVRAMGDEGVLVRLRKHRNIGFRKAFRR